VRRRVWPVSHARILLAGCAAFIAFCFFLKAVQFRFLVVGGFDSAQYDQALWTTLRGHFLKTSLHGRPLSIIALHTTFFHALLAPVYALLPGPQTLSNLQAVLFAAAAFPLFWSARRRLGADAALLFALAYLLNPVVARCMINGYYGTRIFPVPFLIASLWALDEGRDGLFLAFAAMAASCDEATAVVVAGIGVLAARFLGRPRLGACTAVAGIGYFFLAVTWIQVRFGNINPMGPLELRSDGPTRLGWTISFIASHPGLLLARLFEARKAFYLLKLFLPTLFAPLFAASWLLPAVPVFFLTLMLTGRWLLDDFAPAWTALSIPFLFFGAAAGVERLSRRPWARRLGRDPAAVLCAGMIAASLGTQVLGEWTTITYIVTQRADGEDLRTLLRAIPPEASIAASDSALPFLVKRWRAYALLAPGLDQNPDYVLLEEGSIPCQMTGPDRAAAYAALERAVTEGGRYKSVVRAGRFSLWRARSLPF